MEVVIVGAGVFGASLAHRMAGDGHAVTLVERATPGHPCATSGGETRLLRAGHGSDLRHTRSARRARELWRALERETGESLYVEAGVVWLARAQDGWEAATAATLAAAGVPSERLDRSDTERLFPGARLDGVGWALLEPEAGILRAARATAALATAAVASGARLITAAARPDGAAAVLDDGRHLEAERVVWACGPWLAGLFPELANLRVTRQEVVHFTAPPGWATPPVPGWVDYDGCAYGLGDLDGRGVKVCSDAEGEPLDPDRGDRTPSATGERQAREIAAARFPSLAGAAVRSATVCAYELTADTEFLAGPLPGQDTVWLLGGGSGHGFKHGPALAEQVAGALTGAAATDPRRAVGPRTADRSLRTAGLRAARPR